MTKRVILPCLEIRHHVNAVAWVSDENIRKDGLKPANKKLFILSWYMAEKIDYSSGLEIGR